MLYKHTSLFPHFKSCDFFCLFQDYWSGNVHLLHFSIFDETFGLRFFAVVLNHNKTAPSYLQISVCISVVFTNTCPLPYFLVVTHLRLILCSAQRYSLIQSHIHRFITTDVSEVHLIIQRLLQQIST